MFDLEAQETTYLRQGESDVSTQVTYLSQGSTTSDEDTFEGDPLTPSWAETRKDFSDTVDNVQEEIHHIQKAFEEHVQEVEDVEDFFLDTGITRATSLLPTKEDLHDAAEQLLASPSDKLEDTPETKVVEVVGLKESGTASSASSRIPLHAYLILVSAFVALSSIGPFLSCLKNVDPAMKIVWRNSGTALFLAPAAIRSMMTDGAPRLTLIQWFLFMVAAAGYCVYIVAYSIALDYTSVGNATLLANSQSVLLIIVKALSGRGLIMWETVGVAVAFTGAILCSRDDSASPHLVQNGDLSLYGDALSLFSAFGCIAYITLGKSLRNEMNVVVFMFLMMVTTPIMVAAYMWCVGKELTLDNHVDHGVFGWMNLQSDRLPLELCVVLICNVFGTMGYVRAFEYFSAITLSVAALMEPVTATVIAVLLHVGTFPGVVGWLGNGMVILGTLAVMYPTMKNTEEKK